MAQKQKSAAQNAKAAARVRAAQQQKKQRLQWTIGIIVLVVAGVGVLVIAKMSTSDSTTKTGGEAQVAPASIAKDLANVPLDAIAAAHSKAKISNSVKPITDKQRTKNGKPQVLYIGAEFCPYCAGERWALTVALSKFGSFSGLKTINSSESDVPTLTYVNAKYTSKYVAFNPIELQDQEHKPLMKATKEEQDLLQRLGGGAFPFIDFGGKFMQSGGSVEVSNFFDKSGAPKKQVDIASAIGAAKPTDNDTTSLVGNVNAVAGEFIKTICGLTDNQPGNVCRAFSS